MSAVAPLAYLFAAMCFIVGLKRLASPATARSGNAIAALGMLIAIVVTLANRQIVGYGLIAVGLAIGAVGGAVLARTIRMTAMPQMVAALNGFGGGASALVAGAELLRLVDEGGVPVHVGISIQFSVLVGALTFSGSFIAFGKLQEIVTSQPVTYPGQKVLNALLLAAILGLTIFLVASGEGLVGGVSRGPVLLAFVVLVLLALVLGVLSVFPIGGADMPVVVALLNSYSGLAAASTGFVIGNHGLIISGALVGASGLILTTIMCRSMNRSLANVLFGAFGAAGGGAAATPGAGGGAVRSITAEDAATLLVYARSVVFVPGYGLAVSQAQHQLRELADVLEAKGVDVKYAVHPVAGRMPGHMNVLLAEADVPYEKLWEMERINPELERTEVAVVIGANDVVNPAARNTPASPIYGMPIVEVDRAQHVIVMKRSMRTGFAGIENELFHHAKTAMLFGDAKKSLAELASEVRAAS
jgi:H+-translocating NAD(P) transhydrogenase subunit beta